MTGLHRLAFTVPSAATAERAEAALESAFGERVAALSRFEDGDGWTVEALFFQFVEPEEVALALKQGLAPVPGFDLRPLPDRDWVARSLESLPAVSAGRFVVYGAHRRDFLPPAKIGIEIEAGRAFGTGHHASTRGCLQALSLLSRRFRPRRVLDLGTGSGILAIAAARLFRSPATATDIDPIAVPVARANVAANRAGPFVRVVAAPGARHHLVSASRPFDLVLANILAGPLVRLAPAVAPLVVRRSKIILSGLLENQEKMVMSAWRARGFALEGRICLDGWATLILGRTGRGSRSRTSVD